MIGRLGRAGNLRRLGPIVLLGMLALVLAPVPNLLSSDVAVAPPAGDGTGGPGADGGAVAFSGCQRFILPIYPSNTPEWDLAVASDMPLGSILILNLGGTRAGDDPVGAKGGPGAKLDIGMVERVREAQSRGYKVIGYIRTGETGSNSGPRRDRDQTDREIADLHGWYGVDGIFYDEVYSSEEYLEYYQDLIAHGRESVGGIHVLNLGGNPSPEYAALGDVIGTFEGSVEDFATWSLSSWQYTVPASRWAVAVMSVPNAAEMRRVVWLARESNIGYVYATDRFGTSTQNPWTDLPPYWNEQVEKLAACDAVVDRASSEYPIGKG